MIIQRYVCIVIRRYEGIRFDLLSTSDSSAQRCKADAAMIVSPKSNLCGQGKRGNLQATVSWFYSTGQEGYLA